MNDRYTSGLRTLHNIGLALERASNMDSQELGLTTGTDPVDWLVLQLEKVERDACKRINSAHFKDLEKA